jgi:hypothetical protein
MNSRKANKTPFPLCNKSFCFLYRLHVAFEAEQASLPILQANASAPFIFRSEQEPFS